MYRVNNGTSNCTDFYCSFTCTVEGVPCYHNNCSYLNPPRQNGETWISNCMHNTCENGKTISIPVQCPSVTKPYCENERDAVKVFDNGGCCYHYECPCICSGWGDPHIVTFDGQYYGFQKNCTYVLVKEIIPRYNFTVIIDNENCDASGTVTCARALTVKYKNYNIILTAVKSPKYINLVYINGKQILPTYSNNDLTITSTGVELRLRIPEIQAVVLFKLLQFSVELPFSLFHHNTEGQCGTCDNKTSNDCRLPNGQLRSCPEMAHEWRVLDRNKSYCENQPPPPPPSHPPIFPPTPPCDVLNSSVFEECHKVINPKFYYEACKFDVWHTNSSTGCSSLEAYASLCARESICVSWRKATNGLCKFDCPANQIYKPCGPTIVKTCNARYNDKYLYKCRGEMADQKDDECQSFMEGCYCPDGLTRFSSNSDRCVSACCTGPDGSPKELGEIWQSGCQECKCDRDTMGVLCTPRRCPIPTVICREGEVKVNYTKDCCEMFKCECDRNRCDETIPQCKTGFEVKTLESNGSCCSRYTCVPKNVCVFNDTEYKPGIAFFKSQCEKCICTGKKNEETMFNDIQCHLIGCSKNCSEGFEYEPKPGECCGSCKPISCILKLEGKTPVIIQPSTSWSPPEDSCTTYYCKKENGEFIISEKHTECPEFNATKCIPGTEQTDANGCCKTCTELGNCWIKKNITYLETGGCRSLVKVELTSCEGSCGMSSSWYSPVSNMMMHSCTCCVEMKTSKKEVAMRCADNTTKKHTYISVDNCGCNVSECKAATP